MFDLPQSSEPEEQPPRYSMLEASGWLQEGPEVQGINPIAPF
jgi:hypothetical protein